MNTPILRPDSCRHCKHLYLDKQVNQLQCRQGPPTANAILGPIPAGPPIKNSDGTETQPTQMGIQATVSIFPSVHPDMFCGQFVKKIIIHTAEREAIERMSQRA